MILAEFIFQSGHCHTDVLDTLIGEGSWAAPFEAGSIPSRTIEVLVNHRERYDLAYEHGDIVQVRCHSTIRKAVQA